MQWGGRNKTPPICWMPICSYTMEIKLMAFKTWLIVAKFNFRMDSSYKQPCNTRTKCIRETSFSTLCSDSAWLYMEAVKWNSTQSNCHLDQRLIHLVGENISSLQTSIGAEIKSPSTIKLGTSTSEPMELLHWCCRKNLSLHILNCVSGLRRQHNGNMDLKNSSH